MNELLRARSHCTIEDASRYGVIVDEVSKLGVSGFGVIRLLCGGISIIILCSWLILHDFLTLGLDRAICIRIAT